MPRKEGQFLVEDFFLNAGGLNTNDSPFAVDPSEATGGKNYDYIKRGGLQKRGGHPKLNAVANSQLKSLGLSIWDKPGSSREVIRSAGTKIQKFDPNLSTFTNLTEDTATAGSDFLSGGSSVPVVCSMFNTPTTGTLWAAGGGLSSIYGAYSASKVTKNGADVAAGSISTSVGGSGGVFLATGTYYYGVALHKASTGVVSNVALDKSAAVAATTSKVTITLSSITAFDQTKYDTIWIYRSVVSGVSGFTTGDIIAKVASSSSSYVDDGSSISTAENVPRAANIVLDNSVLPAGSYRTITTFKRRLATASGSTLYLSDLGASESWPLTNYITIPSGGDITGLAVISQTTAYNSSTDEVLCIFKQRELWILTGSDFTDWELKHIDNSGCCNQPLLVPANGYLTWLTYRGVFMWDGSGKPSYVSPTIQDKFERGGDIDKSLLVQGFGLFAQDRNEVQWYVSSSTEGTQKYVLKLNLRLTLSSVESGLGQKQIKGVFTSDVTSFSGYAGVSFLSSSTAADESIYLGDDSGFLYNAYSGTQDGGENFDWEYITPYLTLGSPNSAKRLNKVVAWVLDTGHYDLNLDYWSNYRFEENDRSSNSLPVSITPAGVGLIWDEGKWDETFWDGVSNRIKPVVFNLSSPLNNTEGDAFRLRFQQMDSPYAVVFYGFSLYYTELALRK